MPIIVGVKLGTTNNKIYYFDPKNLQLEVGDHVIVETVRGQEYAVVGQANSQVTDDKIVGELKPVIRKATKGDETRYKENQELKVKAFETCQKKIEAHKLKMKLVDAEYTFDRSKVIFSFTADGRIDFRDLVKDLASEMRLRIELRQIYERDDIKLKGAMGMCGRECCCISHLAQNEKATVKMAKTQNISLNPTKVSGMCGKLMCCLKYENEFYSNIMKFMPKVGGMVKIKDGVAKVTEIDALHERIKVAIQKEDGITQQYVNIGDFEIVGKKATSQEDSTDEDADEIKE